MEMLFAWWAWAAAALILGILEMVAPAFILLGFAIGAGVVALLLLIGGATAVGGSVPWMLVIFAVISLIAWLALKRIFRLEKGQTKVFKSDINDH